MIGAFARGVLLILTVVIWMAVSYLYGWGDGLRWADACVRTPGCVEQPWFARWVP